MTGRRVTGRPAPGVATTFLRWTCLRAAFHRGYVLTSGARLGLPVAVTRQVVQWYGPGKLVNSDCRGESRCTE